MKNEEQLKMAVIAGASHALKFKEKNPRVSDSEVLSYVSGDVRRILAMIDSDY